jgi:hypothetical protein
MDFSNRGSWEVAARRFEKSIVVSVTIESLVVKLNVVPVDIAGSTFNVGIGQWYRF